MADSPDSTNSPGGTTFEEGEGTGAGRELTEAQDSHIDAGTAPSRSMDKYNTLVAFANDPLLWLRASNRKRLSSDGNDTSRAEETPRGKPDAI